MSDDANNLDRRKFLTVLGASGGNATVTRAVAFAPDDEQITAFLTRRSVTAYPQPECIPKLA